MLSDIPHPTFWHRQSRNCGRMPSWRSDRAIDNGFYYDFDMEHKLNDQDLLKIQKEMKKMIQANYPLEQIRAAAERKRIKFMADKTRGLQGGADRRPAGG